MKTTCYLMLLLYLFYSCRDNKNRSETSENNFPVQTIQWKTRKDFQIKDIIQEIRYILLEDNENALFSAIDKLIIKGDRIYLLDVTGPKSLLVFDMNGKFLHRVGKQGGGPGEYSQSLINFDVTNNGIVALYDYAKRNMLFYDPAGQFIGSVKSEFSFNDYFLLPDNQYLLSADIHEPHNNGQKIILTADLKKIDSALFHFSDDYKHNKFNIRSFHPYRDKAAYMLPVSDTLFIIDKQCTIDQAYFFDFGDKSLPENLKNDYAETIAKRRDGIFYNYIYNAPIPVGRYLFADLFIDGKKCIGVFDLISNTSTHEVLAPNLFAIENINFPLCALNDSIIVSYIDGNLYDAIKDRIAVNPAVDTHLAEGGAVLCLYIIKTDG